MFTLPPLPYDNSTLEPWLDTETMKIHHDKHHQAYIDNLNKLLEPHPELASLTIDQVIESLTTVPEDIRQKVRNNAGGHWNHSFFWEIMSSAEENAKFNMQNSKLGHALDKNFGSLETFKEKFAATALARFGSGWAWLVDNNGVLEILDTPNQDNPRMLEDSKKPTVLLGLDVWEHAYYLKFQNKRADYIKSWWNVVNWSEVEKRLTNQ